MTMTDLERGAFYNVIYSRFFHATPELDQAGELLNIEFETLVYHKTW